MSDTNAGVYEQEMYIEANPETVFAFFTDPDKMVRWMGVSATLEPKEGGIYLVDVTNGNIAKGEFARFCQLPPFLYVRLGLRRFGRSARFIVGRNRPDAEGAGHNDEIHT